VISNARKGRNIKLLSDALIAFRYIQHIQAAEILEGAYRLFSPREWRMIRIAFELSPLFSDACSEGYASSFLRARIIRFRFPSAQTRPTLAALRCIGIGRRRRERPFGLNLIQLFSLASRRGNRNSRSHSRSHHGQQRQHVAISGCEITVFTFSARSVCF
jgi:hypothetical protein